MYCVLYNDTLNSNRNLFDDGADEIYVNSNFRVSLLSVTRLETSVGSFRLPHYSRKYDYNDKHLPVAHAVFIIIQANPYTEGF